MSVTLAVTLTIQQMPKEKKLRTAEWSRWPRNGSVLGGSDPTFAHDSVPNVTRGSLQPNKKLLPVRVAKIWEE